MSSFLADLCFKNYRRRVLSLLLLRPDESYHTREIARLTHTAAGTLHKELRKLSTAGVLIQSTQGNQVSYQANRSCLIFEELAGILRKTSGLADVLTAALAPLVTQIDFALVFGSIASGKATHSSDIDLLIVGSLSYHQAVSALYSAQQQLGRDINPKIYSGDEWRKLKQANSVFAQELQISPTIPLIGEKDDSG